MTRQLRVGALLLALAAPLAAQQAPDTVPVLQHLELAGPRIGMLYASGPRAEARLAERNLEPFMSLFGWQFEQVVRPQAGGPMLVVEEVVLVAGLDQGVALPSASLLMGVRLPGGLEFGMGPNVSPVGAALAMGAGISFQYGGVTIPVNVAVVRSQGALRTSFLVGYSMRRR